MKKTGNNKGIALITVMILSIVGLGLIVSMINMTHIGTKISGAERRYTTALEAAKGGSEIITNMIQNDSYSPENIAGATKQSGTCVQTKMTSETSSWGSCSSTSDPTDQPDITATLGGYTVYVKFVDSKETNNYWFYTINSRAQKGNEQAEISFLYRIEK
jgi:Tfp pilus assembly protein PilX